MAETHIEQCQACDGNINALHRPSYVQDASGAYYHNTAYCMPADARSRPTIVGTASAFVDSERSQPGGHMAGWALLWAETYAKATARSPRARSAEQSDAAAATTPAQ
jgi:hypothetical protein